MNVGEEELDQNKLTPLLRLKYHNSIADAVADLGQAEEIGKVFAGFQKYRSPSLVLTCLAGMSSTIVHD